MTLVCEDRSWSWEEMDARAAGLAALLRERGVRAGQRVALMSANRPEFVVAVLAVMRLGASVALFSPAWKRREVEHALAVTEPAFAISDCSPLPSDLDLDALPAPSGETFPDPPPDADAVLVFSSGTTGLPKAVRHTHRSLAAAVGHWRAALGMTAGDRLQIATPPSHILGLLNILTARATGAWIRLHRRFDLDRVLECVEKDRITIEMAVAPIALAMARHPRLEEFDLSSLRYIMWGATPVTASVAETVTKRTGVGWLPAYGASELPVITCNPLAGARLDSVGRAVPGVTLRVTSSGEIQARSPSLMAGYLPEDAGSLDGGWYRTGDVGHVSPDGWVHLTGRTKEMIKVKGFQVAPAEIEAVLLADPSVADCGVFGLDDPETGEAIVAAVVPSGPVDPARLQALVADSLASYKRIRRLLIVEEIPRLPSGKLLRRTLKERYGRTLDG